MTLTYDDSGCTSSATEGGVSTARTQAELAATGDNTAVTILASMALLISSLALVSRSRRETVN